MKNDDLKRNLEYAEECRKKEVMPCCWEIKKRTLEFLRAKKAITYRRAKEIISKNRLIKDSCKEFVHLLKKELNPEIEDLHIAHIEGDNIYDHIGIYPVIGGEKTNIEIYEKLVKEKSKEVSKRYTTLLKEIEGRLKATTLIYEYLEKKFKQGLLEEEINDFLYKEDLEEEQISTFPKQMLKKLSAKQSNPKDSMPVFQPNEMDVLHVAWHKSQNMSKKELEVLQKLDPFANTESRLVWHVLIAKEEALNMCYIGGTSDGMRRLQFFKAVESLSQKLVTWVIDKDDGTEDYILHQEPVLRTSFAYELSKGGVEKGRYFCVEIPIKLLNLLEKDRFLKSPKNERLIFRSIPPKLTTAQEKFFIHLKEVAPFSNRSKRGFKWNAGVWALKIWVDDKKNIKRNIDELEEFGKKQKVIGFLKSFDRVEENNEIFFIFKFHNQNYRHVFGVERPEK